MEATATFNPKDYSPRVLGMIMACAEKWNCKPSEALARILDQLAEEKFSGKVA